MFSYFVNLVFICPPLHPNLCNILYNIECKDKNSVDSRVEENFSVQGVEISVYLHQLQAYSFFSVADLGVRENYISSNRLTSPFLEILDPALFSVVRSIHS